MRDEQGEQRFGRDSALSFASLASNFDRKTASRAFLQVVGPVAIHPANLVVHALIIMSTNQERKAPCPIHIVPTVGTCWGKISLTKWYVFS